MKDKKREELIEKVFDIVKDYEGDPNELLTDITRKVIMYQSEMEKAEREKNKAEISKTANEIFELCPPCNFIPVAVETQVKSDFTTSPDIDEIWTSCYNYLTENDRNEYNLVMPHQCDDITFGDWKKIMELWKKLIGLAGYKYRTDNDGDYCEYYHLSVIGFSKDEQSIMTYDDINR